MSDDWKTTIKQEGGITTTAVEKTPKPENWQEVAVLAYQFWEARGCPDGSPEVDWFRAEQEIAAPKRTGEEQIATAEETPSTAPRLPVRSEVAEKVQRASGKA